jgi:hypothetical protein
MIIPLKNYGRFIPWCSPKKAQNDEFVPNMNKNMGDPLNCFVFIYGLFHEDKRLELGVS